MIEITKLTCKYENKTILEDINLTIDSNITIMGANGSGKSSLAKMICNLTPYDGKIELDSTDIQKLSLKERAKSICYIPAKLEVYDNFISVEEFVLQARFAYKKSFLNYSDEDRKIVKQSLEFLNITHLKNHPLNSLSSGEQQLTLIASALTGQSKTIIFDEPTANLDPHNSKIIVKHIKELSKAHKIVLITHDLSIAFHLNNPILFVKDKTIKSYNEEFFQTNTLKKLYGVEFDSLVVKYD